MTDATLERAKPIREKFDNGYLGEGHTVWSWLTTTDHKRIAILYAVTITVFFFIGGAAIAIARLELITPAQDLVTADTYDRLFSIHGIIMVWFFLVPSIPTTFGNFLLPLMIGAPDLAFPKINLLSWYLTILGGAFVIYMLLAGGVDTGWTFYVPFSTNYSNSNVVPALIAVFIAGFGTIATGLNLIVTTHTMRAPGMRWFRLPLFVWSMYTVALVIVLATPVLAMSLFLVLAERVFHL
ncbi:MAG TPA: cbb3-type cytochrome c oxidase subunit I, partial [Pararhizobium sp.]|nr:cbb3-type cytochrome c oxidase subunit I [Pararhizobium sp.]